MSTAAISPSTLPAPSADAGHVRISRIYLLETKYEFLKMLRLPHYLVGTLGFPVMFYLLFGVTLAQKSDGPVGAAEYLLASYCIFGVVTAALFAFGAGVAVERAQGWMTLKRGTPMPVSAYLGAKIISSMCFGTITLILMGLCAVTMAHVRFPASVWLTLWSVMSLGCIPFCLAGLIIAFTVPPTGAPGIVNLINLPLSFAGGLWFPVAMMPRFLQVIAPWVPQYHLGQLALGAIGAVEQPKPLQHVAALVAYAVIFGAFAWRAYRRSDVNQ